MGVLNERAQALRRELARTLARRLKERPEDARAKPLKLSLSPVTATVLYEGTPSDAHRAWKGVEALVEEGLVTLEFDPKIPAATEPFHRKPKVVACPGALPRLALIGEVALPSGFGAALAQVLEARGAFTPTIRAWLAERALPELESFGAENAADRLVALAAGADACPDLYLREISARVFNGLSKVLDGRAEWVATFLGRPCPWRETPIPFLVAAPEGPLTALVFVENLTTFERLAHERARHPGHAFVYASGWRGSAARAAREAGRRLYVDRPLEPAARAVLELALEGRTTTLPIAFYGDLDYAGLGILGSMRATFPGLVAWRPGYEALRVALESGCSHAPAHADKANQVDPGVTGCAYADEVLLPALRARGRFVDQEVLGGEPTVPSPLGSCG